MDKFLNSDSKLSTKEKYLLKRIEKSKELQSFFFRKVKGLKWFDALAERGYFESNGNLKPVPSKEEGYVRIPDWPVIDYLVSTAPELAGKDNQKYAEKFIQILVNVTDDAKKHGFSNYRVWWQFAEIFSQIPYGLISIEHADIVDYWLDDEHGGGGIVAKALGEEWLPSLLQSNNDQALQLAEKVIGFIYKVKFQKDDYGMRGEQSSYTRVEHYLAQEVTKNIAKLAGEKLGLAVVEIFDKSLIKILEKLKSDSWTVYWRPAIEEHEQNATEIILIDAYRDSLDGYIYANRSEALTHIKSMLESQYQTIRRLAIYAITKNGCLSKDIIDQLLDKEYLRDNYRHEMWHFLNKHYLNFSDSQKEQLLNLMFNIKECDREGKLHEGASTYKKTIWLSAIKEHGAREEQLYVENTKAIKTEPAHPDFPFYMSAKRVIYKSPKSLEELQKLSIDELIHFLKNYKDPGRFDEIGLEGLVEVFQQLIKTEPLKFYLDLDKFIELDLAYTHGIIEAYKKLVVEQAKLPWDEIWQKLFEFCFAIIKQDGFWEAEEGAAERFPPVANRNWVVNSVGELIGAGAKSDKYSFKESSSLATAEKILAYILKKQKAELKSYKEHSDAVLISINSPRGYCLKALIELTLHSCRIADKVNDKDHSGVWSHFQHHYDSELERADLEKSEYEFATLVGMYLPNFRYMSEPWVLRNRDRIFDQANYLKWLCAMRGCAYTGGIYQGTYKYLKEHGDLLKALDDKNIGSYGVDWVVQNIAIAYIEGSEPLEQEGSLINELITRNDYKMVGYLIWFIWKRVEEDNDKLKNKVYELWAKILQNIDLSTKDGKKIASSLCHWTVFVDSIDKESLALLLAIAPYSNRMHGPYYLLEGISKISKKQPFEAYEIWIKMLKEGSVEPARPEEAIKTLLLNLVKEGVEGRQKADEIVNEYLKKGNNRPVDLLNEIKNNPNPKK